MYFSLEMLYTLNSVLICSAANWHKNWETGIGKEFRCHFIHLLQFVRGMPRTSEIDWSRVMQAGLKTRSSSRWWCSTTPHLILPLGSHGPGSNLSTKSQVEVRHRDGPQYIIHIHQTSLQGLKIHNSLFFPKAATLGKTGLVSTALPSVMVVWKHGVRAHWVP